MSYRDTIPNLDEMIEQRYISVREHPAVPLYILSYTAKTQFDRMWNEATRQCRGLILDADGNLVSRPFRKFFNLGEMGDVPKAPCLAWEKYDGSLGVSYYVDGRWAIASRGSFTSDQALRATAMLEDTYASAMGRMNPRYTYLFEIIYPDNRIVVDYGDREELRLLAVVDTKTGDELMPPEIGFPVAECHGEVDNPWDLLLNNRPNAEGFVLHWPDMRLRLKVKHDEYLRLHRVVTGFSLKALWGLLRDGGRAGVESLAEQGTTGFRGWVMENSLDLLERHAAICEAARRSFAEVPAAGRKEQALVIQKMENPHLLFAMLDGEPWERMAWDMVKPGRAFETYRKDGE